MSIYRLRWVAVLLLLCLLAGCGGGAKTIRVEGVVEAGDGVNPDSGGRASPVVVRVYQLRNAGSFEGADFFSVYDEEAATLGQDLIAREELRLRPGERLEFKSEAPAGAKFLGAIAAFRNLDTARWRAVAPLPESGSVDVRIQLKATEVSLSVD